MRVVKNTQKLFWVVLCAAMVFSITQKSSAKEVKIAFVDLRRALNETNEGKRAMKKLQKEKDKLQKKIDTKEKSIMAMQEKLKEQQSILSQEALQKKAQEYYQSVQELQQSYGQFQQELAQKEMKATQEILIKMEKIVAEIGKKDGYTMIYDRSVGAVVWAPAHLDLTDQLIQMYNAQYK
ncbi:MAG: OmpH family outer membrane protein [Deltaproteobacteria bacterium]|nr:OmpH family outer membrane protein [Deltaproteobacteria bacterium]